MSDILKNQRIKLIEDNIIALLANWKDLKGAEFIHDSTKVQLITGMPFAFLNSIANVNFTGTDIKEQIEATLIPCKARKVPVLWWIGPNSKPDDLDVYLEELGFKKTDEPPGMYMDLNSLVLSNENIPELKIEFVQNKKHVEDWVSAFIAGLSGTENQREYLFKSEITLLQKSDYIRFVGYWNGEPVAVAALFLDENVAGVYFVITKPDHRGKGIGTAITIAALKNAKERGYQDAILQSSQMGYNIYRRIGFEEYCKFKWYHYRFK